MAPLVPPWPWRSTHQANIEPDGTPHACGPSDAEESHDEPRHVGLRWSQPVHSERRKRNPDQHERGGEVRVLESPTAVAPEWLEADKAPPEVMFRIAGHGVSIEQKAGLGTSASAALRPATLVRRCGRARSALKPFQAWQLFFP